MEAVRRTIILGLACGGEIPEESRFDRKHYFYPDSPKGYQISQYKQPFVVGGSITLLANDGSPERVIRLERIHLEEDAGKLTHASDGTSLVDLNRAGVPLVEMVSRPDLTSGSEARRFMQEVQQLVRYLGISDADMEKGQMRADVNISTAFEHNGVQVATPITEVKNVNSTRAVERAIAHEAERQYAEWIAGGPITLRKGKITVGWDETTETVNLQRAKENAADYRYMPEPDLPVVRPYEVPALNPETLRASLPVLPNELRREFLGLGLKWSEVEVLVADATKTAIVRTVLDRQPSLARGVASWVVNSNDCQLSADDWIELAQLSAAGSLSFSAVKPHLPAIAVEVMAGMAIRAALESRGLLTAHDAEVVAEAITSVLAEEEKAVAQYRAGEVKVLGFLTGKVMQRAKGKAVPSLVQQALQERLS
jgi:aspartyl-tRNA(Asn)/glutamyl-tRNA(Gln) amidotransferase subunit B